MKPIEAQRLIEIRGELTQEDFASLIGSDRVNISNVESGKRALSLKTAKSIREQFGVSLDWIYGYTDVREDAAGSKNQIEEKEGIINSLKRELEICQSNNELLKSLIKN